MNAYNTNGGFATTARNAVRNRSASFGDVNDDPTQELHNARGLVIAIMMSAAC